MCLNYDGLVLQQVSTSLFEIKFKLAIKMNMNRDSIGIKIVI